MSKHTATPWAVTGQSEAGRYIKVTDAKGRTVARVPFSSVKAGEDGTATDASDASLIAAAPDLLTALFELVACADPHRDHAEINAARRAIAKARGRA